MCVCVCVCVRVCVYVCVCLCVCDYKGMAVMCSTRILGGEVGKHAHWQMQCISGRSLKKKP